MKGQMKSALMEMSLKDADYERKSEFEKDFKFNRKLKDPRFGEVSLIQNPKTRQFLAVKEKRINDKKEAGKAIVNARKRLSNKHPNILNLLDYSVTKQSELCSSFYVLKLFYEFPRSDLHRETQERSKKGESFSDTELTHILYQQIAANSYLQSKDQHHGDIQPLNIAYDKTNNVSQLIDMSEDATTQNLSKQLQKNRVVAGQPLYQSPATYANLKKGNLNYTVDPSKEDVYALGLTLLEVGNGQSIQNIYNATTKEVDQVALQKHIAEFKRRHGSENSLLTSAVETMVHPEEARRPNFKEMEGTLPPYATIQQFLKDRQTNSAHGMLNSNQFAFGQATAHQETVTKVEPHVHADWDFGSTGHANYEFVSTHQSHTPRTENIPLIDLPINNSTVKSNVDVHNVNKVEYNTNATYRVEGGMDLVPVEKKVVILNDNKDYIRSDQYNTYVSQNVKTNTLESVVNTTQPSINQSVNRVTTLTHEPVYNKAYVSQNESYSLPYVNTSYQSNVISYQAEPRVEYVTLEPEYRTEYISANDRRTEVVNASNQNIVIPAPPTTYVRKSYVNVQNDGYTIPQSTVIRKSYIAPQTDSYVVNQPTIVRKSFSYARNDGYVAPQTQTVTYTTPQTQTVTYAAPETYTTYVAPTQTQTVTYTAPETQTIVYNTPMTTEYKNVSYGVNDQGQYISERVVDTRYTSQNNVETSGLKLVRTYQDNTNSTRAL